MIRPFSCRRILTVDPGDLCKRPLHKMACIATSAPSGAGSRDGSLPEVPLYSPGGVLRCTSGYGPRPRRGQREAQRRRGRAGNLPPRPPRTKKRHGGGAAVWGVGRACLRERSWEDRSSARPAANPIALSPARLGGDANEASSRLQPGERRGLAAERWSRPGVRASGTCPSEPVPCKRGFPGCEAGCPAAERALRKAPGEEPFVLALPVTSGYGEWYRDKERGGKWGGLSARQADTA